jgi:hypothetical protein
MSEASMLRIISGFPIETQTDPIGSGTFQHFPTAGNRRIRHLATSRRNSIPRNPTTSDRILLEVVGFLSDSTVSEPGSVRPGQGRSLLHPLLNSSLVSTFKSRYFYSSLFQRRKSKLCNEKLKPKNLYDQKLRQLSLYRSVLF